MCVLCMYAYEDFLSISFFLFVLLRKPHNHLFYSTADDSFKKRFHYASSALQTSSDHHQNGREKIHTLEYPRGCEKILFLILSYLDWITRSCDAVITTAWTKPLPCLHVRQLVVVVHTFKGLPLVTDRNAIGTAMAASSYREACM